MKSLFEDLKEGLQEAIDYEVNSGSANEVTYIIEPVKIYDNEEIRTIRNNAHMTQSVFASYMGVSKKTVEAWERGRIHPTGPACRLMELLAMNEVFGSSFIKIIKRK